MLVSPDTDALDQLENLMLQVAPPKRPYQVFHIKHASAFWMKLNLEDYFKDLDEEDSSADQFYRWYWGGDDSDSSDKEPAGLGKGVKLRFVEDPDTNTLVVNGASSQQLRTIAELIKLWDVPEPVNKRKTRYTDIVPVNFGRAEKIAETVKEAYRDLLSSNDKAFAAGQGQNQAGGAAGTKNQASKSRGGSGSSLQDSTSDNNGGGADFSFKGKLSIGVDGVGNTLVVSAEGEPLLQLIVGMIEKLDEAARPAGEVQVIQLPGGISGRSLQLALKAMGAEQPEQEQMGKPKEQDQPDNNFDRRDRSRNGKFQNQANENNVDVAR